jgi:hypothetical protein
VRRVCRQTAQVSSERGPSRSVGEARACRVAPHDMTGAAAMHSMAGARRTSHDRWRSCVALQVCVASHRIASQTSSDAESTRWMSSMQSSVGGSEASAIRAMSSDLSSDDVSSYRTWLSTLEYPETPLSRLKSTLVDPLGTSHI